MIASGRPAAVKPMKIGIDEQEQSGVIVPRSAASVFAQIPERPPRMRRVRSGGKKLWTQETAKISTDSRMKILMTSKTKNCTDPPRREAGSSPAAETPFVTRSDSHCIRSS